ncbi:MAG: NERD domain-containing protein [Mycobacteriales bacterium]|nr:NERD domain-containing protein [Mycobacteriales bacterium]
MARFFPPDFPERDLRWGERAVWDALATQLPADCAVFYSLRLPDGRSEREIDFLVAWPGEGLVVIEVKGGHVERDEGGTFWSRRGAEEHKLKLNPMEQASEVRHLLTEWLQEHGCLAARARTQHLVVLPHVDVGDYDAHDFRRTQVVDRGDMAQLAARVLTAATDGDGHAPLSREAYDQLTDVLMPRLMTDPEQSDVAVAEQVSDALSAELAERVAEWQMFPQLMVIGGAGTGKTWLAMAQARRLAAQGKRVALVCYSRGLAAFLQKEAATWSKPPAYVGLFHRLGTTWGGPPPDEFGADRYWEQELPRSVLDLAAAAPIEQRFDAVVVDEGQDFGEQWWETVRASLRGPDHEGLYVFLDSGQRVFPRQGEVPIDLPPIILSRNLRNTQRIAGFFSSLVTVRSTAKGLKGPRVRLVACDTADALTRADDAVDLLEETWEPGQLALLTTHHRHSVHDETIKGPGGWDAYWEDYFSGESVCYGTVSGFKGLERSCVVLAVNGFSDEAKAKEMLYVGLSRARSQLVVVGDPELIASVGDGGIRKRLDEAELWDPRP